MRRAYFSIGLFVFFMFFCDTLFWKYFSKLSSCILFYSNQGTFSYIFFKYLSKFDWFIEILKLPRIRYFIQPFTVPFGNLKKKVWAAFKNFIFLFWATRNDPIKVSKKVLDQNKRLMFKLFFLVWMMPYAISSLELGFYVKVLFLKL